MSEETTNEPTQKPDENPEGKGKKDESIPKSQYEDIQGALTKERNLRKNLQEEVEKLKLQNNEDAKEAYKTLREQYTKLEEDLENKDKTIGSIVTTFKEKADKKALELMPEGLSAQAELNYLLKSMDVFSNSDEVNKNARNFRGIQNPKSDPKSSISEEEFVKLPVEERVKRLDEVLGKDGVY